MAIKINIFKIGMIKYFRFLQSFPVKYKKQNFYCSRNDINNNINIKQFLTLIINLLLFNK